MVENASSSDERYLALFELFPESHSEEISSFLRENPNLSMEHAIALWMSREEDRNPLGSSNLIEKLNSILVNQQQQCCDAKSFQATLKALLKCVSQLLLYPAEPHYRELKESNTFFFDRIGRWHHALEFLFSIGFERQKDEYGTRFVIRNLVIDHLEEARSVLVKAMNRPEVSVLKPSSSRKRSRLTSEQMAEKCEKRLCQGNEEVIEIDLDEERPGESSTRIGTAEYYHSQVALKNQLAAINKQKHQDYRRKKLTGHPVVALESLKASRKEESAIRLKFDGSGNSSSSGAHSIVDFMNPDRIERDCLLYTNEFRRARGINALNWHQKLADIGRKHSKDMAENKVGFGHQGFQARTQLFPFSISGASENVAKNLNHSDVARAAVDGWINSR